MWLSDHLCLDLARYGGPSERRGASIPSSPSPRSLGWSTRPRLGTLVLCEALRPASVLAKTFATLDRICDGRLDIGLGAGWYEPDYTLIGMEMPPPKERLARLREAIDVCRGLLGGGPFTFDGALITERSTRTTIRVPCSDRRRRSWSAAKATGSWRSSPSWPTGGTPVGRGRLDAYRERLGVLERACEAIDRDPATVTRSLGLYALCGEDETDLARRFERLRALSPPGVLDAVDPRRVAERPPGRHRRAGRESKRKGWADLGIETLVVTTGAVPFAVTTIDDVELLATAIRER